MMRCITWPPCIKLFSPDSYPLRDLLGDFYLLGGYVDCLGQLDKGRICMRSDLGVVPVKTAEIIRPSPSLASSLSLY